MFLRLPVGPPRGSPPLPNMSASSSPPKGYPREEFQPVSMCFRSGVCCFPHGRAGHKNLADPEQETRPASGVSYTLSLNSSWQPTCQGMRARPRGVMGKTTHRPDAPCGGFWQRPAAPSSTAARGIQVGSRRPKNSGDSELPTSGSASLFKVKHCGIQFPNDLCVARPHTEIPP